MKRLFIGFPIELPKTVRKVEAWRNNPEMNRNLLKWVNPENWHITLFFLGNTDESKIDLLNELIGEAYSGVTSVHSGISGIGCFPDQQKPKILWFGLKNSSLLIPARSRLGDLLTQHHFSFDPKPLNPHLTFARVKRLNNRTAFESWLKKYKDAEFERVSINRVALFESITTPNGPVYLPLFVKDLES